jgi:hypothetical protein
MGDLYHICWDTKILMAIFLSFKIIVLVNSLKQIFES